MTNKQERYYAVSEDELMTLIQAAMDAAHDYRPEKDNEFLNEAKTACCTREIPWWATHVAEFDTDRDIEETEIWVVQSVKIERLSK